MTVLGKTSFKFPIFASGTRDLNVGTSYSVNSHLVRKSRLCGTFFHPWVSSSQRGSHFSPRCTHPSHFRSDVRREDRGAGYKKGSVLIQPRSQRDVSHRPSVGEVSGLGFLETFLLPQSFKGKDREIFGVNVI